MKNIEARKLNIVAMVAILIALVFGIQPAFSAPVAEGAAHAAQAGEVQAGEALRIGDDLDARNQIEENLKDVEDRRDIEDLDLDDVKDEKAARDENAIEDREIKDEDLELMALRMKLLGRDMEKVFRDERDVARLLDPDVNKGMLAKEDMVKSLQMHEQLIAKADEHLAREDNGGTGSADEDRVEFQGIIDSMPAGLQGDWMIGGVTLSTTPETQFDELEGPLQTGGCAKVDVRNGMVHEIDSQEIGNCV